MTDVDNSVFHIVPRVSCADYAQYFTSVNDRGTPIGAA